MGDARKLWIEGPAGRLEAALRLGAGRGSAVIAHPHPADGGTLHNPVVFHTDRALNRAGWTTLRFDFRGVGTSDGVHDEGRGERFDLAAAVGWLAGLDREAPLLLVGYSFGSWCAVRHAAEDPRITALVALGLPVRRYGFGELGRIGRPLAVVQADGDELGPPAEVAPLLAELDPPGKLLVVESSDHLFTGRAARAAELAVDAAAAIAPPGRSVPRAAPADR